MGFYGSWVSNGRDADEPHTRADSSYKSSPGNPACYAYPWGLCAKNRGGDNLLVCRAIDFHFFLTVLRMDSLATLPATNMHIYIPHLPFHRCTSPPTERRLRQNDRHLRRQQWHRNLHIPSRLRHHLDAPQDSWIRRKLNPQ